MLSDGWPMPDASTEIGRPPIVPVQPSIERTSLTSLASVKNSAAMRRPRRGSPGINTTGANSPSAAEMWGVGTLHLDPGWR